jgi:hypothetical protein
MKVHGVLNVLRDHKARQAGLEPATGCLEAIESWAL